MTKKTTIRLTESDLKRVISESVNKVSKEAYKDPFNFFPNKDFQKTATHRIEFFYKRGGDVSSPGIFSSDEDAINAAIEEANSQSGICGGICGIRVQKYSDVFNDNGRLSLEVIYEKGKTY
jgi:hypothetical protein